MSTTNTTVSRRSFLKRSGLALGAISIIPAYVLGGNGRIAPSDKIQLGFIGTGKQGLGLGKRFSALDSSAFRLKFRKSTQKRRDHLSTKA